MGLFFGRRNRKLKLKQLMQTTMVFWRIWRQLAGSFRHNRFAPIGLAVLAMALLHNSFVVMFFQNLVVAAIPFWVFMGLCVGLSFKER